MVDTKYTKKLIFSSSWMAEIEAGKALDHHSIKGNKITFTEQLLCHRNRANYFIFIILFNSHGSLCEVDEIIAILHINAPTINKIPKYHLFNKWVKVVDKYKNTQMLQK